MLILKEAQVEPCQVVKQEAGELKSFPGVAYQEKLFRRVKQCPGLDNSDAVALARQIYHKTNGQSLVLVVEEEVIHSVWCEDRSLGRSTDVTAELSRVQQFNLEAIVTQMRNVGGIAIKDRRYNFKVYPRCFVGQEASAWLMETLSLSAEEAVSLGQRLIDERWIYHVTHDHDFQNAELFYRFYWDDK